MVADDTFLDRARPWLGDHRAEMRRMLAIPLALVSAWWLSSIALPPVIWGGLLIYALIHLTLIRIGSQSSLLSAPLVTSLSLFTDASLAGLVLAYGVALPERAIYPLYLLIALRALVVYQQTPAATVIPFMLGPAYLFAHSLSRQSPPLSIFDQQAQWALLVGSLGFGAVAIWSSATQQRQNQTLRQSLQDAQVAAELRVTQLERTANDLRARMREQHAMEEGLRVITSLLSLDEVLNQIVDSTVQMLGPARVYGIALSLETDGTFAHRSLVPHGVAETAWKELLARRVMHQEVPLIINDLALDASLAAKMPRNVQSALSVPLFVGAGLPRGALTVVSMARCAFSSSDARHLTAFAIQAGIAIGNAELHSQIRQQQHLLESVIRDISDGLIVIDAHARIVLTNPLGHTLLESQTSSLPVRDQLLRLAESMRSAERTASMCEIRLKIANNGDLETAEQTYIAMASQVRRDDDNEPLIAIVLHDITAQKAEERSRTEFFSMVAHELRNPLNSLNGFLKIVLQGRAGTLAPMQQEFLEIADSQADRLKNRINELLDSRLQLNLQPNDLPLLAASTVTRLGLQAEQNGLVLRNMVDPHMPEFLFDSERIGQVLTNLIENAFKATPPGGQVCVQSILLAHEVWVQVIDTGVGIPAEKQSRIFQKFYKSDNRNTSHGHHLGLGLAICQQIIEEHKGRIWVESEEGRGTCFTFALPLIQAA